MVLEYTAIHYRGVNESTNVLHSDKGHFVQQNPLTILDMYHSPVQFIETPNSFTRNYR